MPATPSAHKHGLLAAGAAAAWLCCALALPQAARAAEAPAPAVAAAAASQQTASGHSYSPPEGFALKTEGRLSLMTAPEGDATLAIADLIDLAEAKDADSAVAQAWALFKPGFKRSLRLAMPRPPRHGWEEQRVYDYETSPNERLVVQALARRAGTRWVVLMLEGSEATLEKRSSPINQTFSSLRPQGYQRESFAGRKPLPLTPERIAALKAFLAQGMKALDVPGVGFSLIDGNKVVFEGGLGVRALGSSKPVDADTLFMAASNTKAMTTALLAQAVDAGRLRWDQPAAQAFPGFKLADPAVTQQVQIKHLVCACTGMPRQDLEWLFGEVKAPASATFDQLSLMKPTSRFGEVFQYSNLMVAAGGYIAAAAFAPGQDVGQAYDRLMRDKLFAPLGMKNTTFDFAQALRSNHAEPHGDDLMGRTRPARMDLNYTVVPARPAGAVWTSPRDFSRYVLMELGRGRSPEGQVLISEPNWRARYEPQVMVGEDIHYGMGLMIDRQQGITVVRHGGDMIGFHSDMFWLPDYGIGGTILTNSDSGVLLRGPFLRKLLEIVFEGKPEADERLRLAALNRQTEAKRNRELLTLPVPTASIEALNAGYVSKALGPIQVSKKAGKLDFRFQHWHSEVALRKAEDGTQSFITIDPGIGGIEFVLGTTPSGGSSRTTAPLILRDAQHEYEFAPACGRWKQDDNGAWTAAACGR